MWMDCQELCFTGTDIVTIGMIDSKQHLALDALDSLELMRVLIGRFKFKVCIQIKYTGTLLSDPQHWILVTPFLPAGPRYI